MALSKADCTFRSGKLGVSFDMTNLNDTTALLVKDSTSQIYYVHQIHLCCGSLAKLSIFDGSAGNMKIAHSTPVDAGGNMNISMNFTGDPLVFDDASAMCISAGIGAFWGFIKYEIGLGA